MKKAAEILLVLRVLCWLSKSYTKHLSSIENEPNKLFFLPSFRASLRGKCLVMCGNFVILFCCCCCYHRSMTTATRHCARQQRWNWRLWAREKGKKKNEWNLIMSLEQKSDTSTKKHSLAIFLAASSRFSFFLSVSSMWHDLELASSAPRNMERRKEKLDEMKNWVRRER